MPEFAVGGRWRSAVCDTEIMVVRAPSEPIDLRCGGAPLAPIDAVRDAAAAPAAGADSGTGVGKRYTDPVSGLEVLCTKGGRGTLAVGDVPLELKSAKPLPASD